MARKPDAEEIAVLDEKLELLPSLDRKALLQEFQSAYGRNPPLRLSDYILRLAIAYRLQEKVYGGLKPSIRKSLLNGSAIAAAKSVAAHGTVLIREWHGQQHAVTVHADHVLYAGERYRSLTQVAYRISGQKRSGPLFFGLKAKHGR